MGAHTLVQKTRRSGRIWEEVDIVLLGTDTTGKVFSEQTKTSVLGRHRAGVVSRYRFAPDEVLTLRIPDSNKEAEIRLVGENGGEPALFVPAQIRRVEALTGGQVFRYGPS